MGQPRFTICGLRRCARQGGARFFWRALLTGRCGERHVWVGGLRSRKPRVRRGFAAVVERRRAQCADVRCVGDLCGSATGDADVVPNWAGGCVARGRHGSGRAIL